MSIIRDLANHTRMGEDKLKKELSLTTNKNLDDLSMDELRDIVSEYMQNTLVDLKKIKL